MSRDLFEISITEVSEVAARVVVRYTAEADALEGLLRGPYCATAHTLPAEYPLHTVAAADLPTVAAVITDPCLWSPELPHLYRIEVRAARGGRTVAECFDEVGLRRTTPAKNWDHIK